MHSRMRASSEAAMENEYKYMFLLIFIHPMTMLIQLPTQAQIGSRAI